MRIAEPELVVPILLQLRPSSTKLATSSPNRSKVMDLRANIAGRSSDSHSVFSPIHDKRLVRCWEFFEGSPAATVWKTN